ncbi:MAG TPA: hypothetical protein VLA62_08575 [Solirubrobacterales bacterium]|nr:hypothetical protein [Solirubrobacterales bacterium]
MAEARSANPLVDQFRRGGIPRDLRLMAAQGALPLKPVDLAELLVFLLADGDDEVRAAADATLRELPAESILALCKDRGTPPEVLRWVISQREEKELREAALQNTSADDGDLRALAPGLSSELAELIVINQARLLRSTPLLEAIESNPSLNNDQRRRLRELRETFRIGLAEAKAPAAPSPAAPAAPAAPLEPTPPPEPELPEEPPPATDSEAIVRYLTEEEQDQEERVSAVQRLYRLNTAEKVVTALKGNREERAVLVRDPNRIVATAVLGSPRLTDAEVEAFASMKNVSGEVLRIIGANREWSKRYGVVSSLVRNPRTPLAISLGMVSRLNPRDLKSISVDKNVPDVIRKQAQRFVKGPPQGPGGARH